MSTSPQNNSSRVTKLRQLILFSLLAVSLMLNAAAADEQQHPMPERYVGSSALESIKALEGTWKGAVVFGTGEKSGEKDGETEKETSVTYRVTSHGSAVIETIFIGTPMEMTSVYYDRDGKLAMTHYCAVANRPLLTLREETKNTLTFSYADGEELDPKKDMHIHGLKLELKGKDTIEQTWIGFEGGKETHSTKLQLTRVKKEPV